MLAVKLWFKVAWEWLKKYWKWLIFPAGVVLYFVGRFSAKKDITVVSPELVGHQEVKERLNAEADQKKQVADEKATSQLSAIEVERTSTAAKETQKHIDEIEAAQGDPQKVTDLLKDVGKDIREGKR